LFVCLFIVQVLHYPSDVSVKACFSKSVCFFFVIRSSTICLFISAEKVVNHIAKFIALVTVCTKYSHVFKCLMHTHSPSAVGKLKSVLVYILS